MTVTKTPSQTQPKSPPVYSVTPPPPRPNIIPAPVVDPAVVSAVVEAKMQHFLKELQLKQERHLSQMKETQQLDMQVMTSKLEALGSDVRHHVEQEVAGVSRRMKDYQTYSQSAAASLNLKIQTLEAQNAKLSQELLSVQLMPSPSPCPDITTSPIQNTLTPELHQAMEKWLTSRIQEQEATRPGDQGSCTECRRPMADKMADFALETQGASVISTRCSETYRIRSACVTLFGFPLWYPSESPRTVIQGHPVLLPGKCWAFHGVQGTLVISLSHPIMITHVTLDHLPRYNAPTGRIDSAPKDFEVHGMKSDAEEGTFLGTFTYNEHGDPTQTFELPNPSDAVYRVVELRVLSNWGHIEYTCLYRFRVHGKIPST
ncbi:klaroid protein [Cololabis saira]|uniref:klaroid protein n=1 Tax=Cololabis saira TaxID=129043 RepID=UPI002AD4026F|nr:klaroid protein [Cololabis saira]